MVMRKKIEIVSGRKSIFGARQLMDLIPFNIAENDSVNKVEHDSLVIAHNIRDIPVDIRSRTVVFGLQGFVNTVLNSAKMRKSFQDHPVRAIFTNTGTAAADLNRVGLSADVLYRPGKLPVIGDYTPLPQKPRVLIYWKADHPPMAPYRDAVVNLIKALPEIDFWVVPDSEPPAELPNVKALGRAKLREVATQVDGMVRICDRYDYGRSTFDVLLAGRWVVYNDMPNELFSVSVPVEQMAAFVRQMVDDRSDDQSKRRFEEVNQYFSKANLRQRWTTALEDQFLDDPSGGSMADNRIDATIEEFCTTSHPLADGQVSIDRRTGEISQSGQSSEISARILPDGPVSHLASDKLIVDAQGVVELSRSDTAQGWYAFIGKSPAGYFMTAPIEVDRFEACNKVHGFLHEEQALALFHAGILAKNDYALLEIGAYHGKSTNFLAEGAQATAASIISVDTFENQAMTEGLMPTFEAYSENVSRFGTSVRPIKGFSHDVVDQTPEKLDYLFIDGDHSVKGCATDIKHYYERVRPSGIISFDDYYDKSVAKRVKTVVDYCVARGLLTFVTNARAHAVTVKTPACCVVHTPKTRTKARAFVSAHRAEGQNAFAISTDVMTAANDQSILADAAMHAADRVVSVNQLGIPTAVRRKCVLVLLKSATAAMMTDQDQRKSLSDDPFMEVIVADEPSAVELANDGISVRAADWDVYASELGRQPI